MAHIDKQQNSNLQALETRKVDDSIEALGNYISYLIPSFRRSTVSSGNVKKIESLAFLNEAEDLRKLEIK